MQPPIAGVHMVHVTLGHTVSEFNFVVVLLPGWSYYQGGLITRVALLPGWSYYQGGLINRVALLTKWLFCQGGLISRMDLLPGWPY